MYYKGYKIVEKSIDEYEATVEGVTIRFHSLDDVFEYLDEYKSKGYEDVERTIDRFWYIYRIKSSDDDRFSNRMYIRAGTHSMFSYHLDSSRRKAFISEYSARRHLDKLPKQSGYSYHVTSE